MEELISEGGIRIKCKKQAVAFYPNAHALAPVSVLKIPEEFRHIAVEFYDLILEKGQPTALLGCRSDCDIAIQLDEETGSMTGWHWFK